MKIKPKSSELSREEKFTRAIKNALNTSDNDDFNKEKFKKELVKIVDNFNKEDENKTEEL